MSVSHWLEGLKGGDSQAAAALWERYGDRLARLARKKLRGISRRVTDEDDVALSAFTSLCLGAREGRFPALAHRNNLWGLLVFITAQKAADRIAYERRQKHGGGKVRGESVFVGAGGESVPAGLDGFLAAEPGPVTLNIWEEEYKRLLSRLNDDKLRAIAELRVRGHTVDEIAGTVGVATVTVHRKLQRIRSILGEDAAV
jgi:DNA-directed RNA polymerase specialized sigma24 family protein